MFYCKTARKPRLFPGVFALVLSFVLGLSYAAYALDASVEISRIQKSYENIDDLKGVFVQINYIKDLDRTNTYEGEFFIKRPSMMRWTYKGENAQEMVINGDKMMIYKNPKQSYVARFDKESYGQAPVALLNGFASIEDEFVAKAGKGAIVLSPKKKMGNIKHITLVTSREGFPIKSFRIEDEYSNTVEITLKHVRLNTGVPETIFEIKAGKEPDEHNP